MGADFHRHHPTTGNSCVTRHCSSPDRRSATRGLAPAGRDLLYVLAPAPNLSRGTIDWSAAPVAAMPTRSSTPCNSDCFPACAMMRKCCTSSTPPTGRTRAWLAGSTVLACPHLRPNRAVPPGQHGARHRQRGAGRILHGARGGRAHRVDLRAAGRRPDHRNNPSKKLDLKAGLA